jgi:hypothetical protein
LFGNKIKSKTSVIAAKVDQAAAQGIANAKTNAVKSEVQPTATGGKTIGLGVDDDLVLHRGTGAIIYKGAGW